MLTGHRVLWCGLLLALGSATGNAAEWVQTWGAAPLPPTPALGPFPATPSFANQTVRQVVRISAGGQKIRIRFTNEYGTKPLVIGAARVALADESGNIKAGTEHSVLFSGHPSVTIPAAAPFVSDPIDLPVQALGALSISLYLPEDTGQCTCHQVGVQNAFVSDAGDFTGAVKWQQKAVELLADKDPDRHEYRRLVDRYKGKKVVLGLVTSKRAQLEDKDAIKRRLEEASKFVPLDQICLSPQCGFSSTVDGNALTWAQQEAKLRLVVETAREVWG